MAVLMISQTSWMRTRTELAHDPCAPRPETRSGALMTPRTFSLTPDSPPISKMRRLPHLLLSPDRVAHYSPGGPGSLVGNGVRSGRGVLVGSAVGGTGV